MQVQPYLDFSGRCEEALEFYRRAVGAEVTMMMRYNESPDQSMITPGVGDKVMHASFRIGDSTVMGSDGRNTGTAKFEGICLSLTVANEADAKRYFAALGEGGQVHMPLAKTFFSPSFGMLADRFGVAWMIYVHAG